MNFGRRKYTVTFIAAWFCFFSQVVSAVLFEPGAGFGLEYTDNATLVKDDKIKDLIMASYVGGRLSEYESALTYDVAASFNNASYTQGSFSNQRRFNLGAGADWAMIKERLSWFLSDNYGQDSIVALDANTPDNLQDSNILRFGADIAFPVSARQSFSLLPMYTQYYYSILTTDSNQYSLSANWNYQMFRSTGIGLSFSARKIEYTEKGILGRTIDDITFTTIAAVFNGRRLRSSFSTNLGATTVKRERGQESTGFTGYLTWLADLTSGSRIETQLSSEITDTGNASTSIVGGDVQIAADVIRSSVIYLGYSREDASVNTSLSTRYNKLKYSSKPLDRITQDVDFRLGYPVTQLLSSEVYTRYKQTIQLDTDRQDKLLTVGGNLRYKFSRKLKGLLDLKYRTKNSTTLIQNYSEYTVFVSLVYGFGDIQRPSRAGGY